MSTIEKAIEKLGSKKALPEKERIPAADAHDTLEKLVSGDAVKSGPVNVKSAAKRQAAIVPDLAKVVPAQGVRPILELPLAAMADKGMVTPLAPRSRVAEEFRTIKRPLLRNTEDAAAVNNTNLIMVTSALQGDGKTFTALNLAISIALEQDKTVLFVDADVARASAGSLLGVPEGSPGLTDVLEDKGVSLADAIMQTSIANLRVLPAGNTHERATELLASRSMQELMLEMASRYADRVIIFDSPPLLMTTESSVLASCMGQIAFVVSTDETPQEAITEALEHIGDDQIIGMVLNKAHARRNNFMSRRYGYGYGYGYGSGDRQDLPGRPDEGPTG